jgi:hypothetical protein
MVKHYLGWNNLKYALQKRTRKRPPRQDIPDSTIQLIRQYNAFDLELYDIALRMFDQQIALLKDRGVDIEAEFAQYKAQKE